MTFQTEIQFTLPRGYMSSEGTLHKEGLMRLATAADEILPLKDARVQQNPAYLTVILLSRVVTKLGTLGDVHPGVIEGLYASDLSYLQALYQNMNGDGAFTAAAVCPKCEHHFDVRFDELGGSMKAYPVRELYEEMAFVAYYFHWPAVEIMQLPHGERRRWCEEISRINRDLNGERKNIFAV